MSVTVQFSIKSCFLNLLYVCCRILEALLICLVDSFSDLALGFVNVKVKDESKSKPYVSLRKCLNNSCYLLW